MKRINIFLIVLVGFLIVIPSKSYAIQAQYSVETILPENQIDKNVSYFSMRMKPKQEQDIALSIHNSGNEKLNLIVEPHNAFTNGNGVIVYNEEKDLDKSLKYPFTKLVSKKQEVQINPRESKVVTFSIKMPNEIFDGMILGGLRVYKDDSNDIKETKSVQIRNKIEYEISVKLTETDNYIKPNINLIDVFPGLDNYNTSIFTKLQNNTATVIENLSVDTKIFKQNTKQPIYTLKKEKMRMAPNSNFDLAVRTGNKELKPGKYIAKITAQSNDYKWDLTKEFEIKKVDAKKYNNDAVNIEETSNINFYLLLLLTVLIVLLLLILLTVLLKKRSKD
ncbi:DUF916 and DUF3324 domain-containing protein [Vagococcus xieshaowenii]|uniref:DUF916 and DUF3324 domain-containing protein n=1 Tax=Vagococcus xieshaowenii TaxID=2562451 RepID=A0AAJ5EEL0_9ENTE|nr:DUF916 and DUF3324 domain-containing protein [Vagococcus xieshaowenii]QCA27927.1 DUF916 and DUF3324 domain-containing protein [Vagococcus xieshaowenii]TFZ39396.1 DUF916 and DUF3324 domain-containing protein [Vagococcus xieshaowenii]